MEKIKHINKYIAIAILALFTVTSCEDFIHVDVEKSQIVKEVVFSNDNTATSAILGIYSDMYNSSASFASGAATSITSLCGISADELDYNPDDVTFNEFERYTISWENSSNLAIWKSIYQTIYSANSALEGLQASTSLSPAVQSQLMGEALFLRAFAYFYLINVFGDAPLVLSTDYEANSVLSRRSTSEIYNQIVSDLILAEAMLADAYPTNERIRPNKAAASALLARVYLYLGNWALAETQATRVIADERYSLLDNLSQVFLANSKETIWQLRPSVPEMNTNEGRLFILYWAPTDPSTPFSLSSSLMSSFEVGDERLTNWVGTITDSDHSYAYPFKYKQSEGALVEYSIVLRLAEQILIRAEARARLDNLGGAIADVDNVRKRAGLPLIADTNAAITKDELLAVIAHEKQIELFSEWGHRWLDLKRTGRADALFNGYSGYTPDYKLYPVPKNEFDRNPFLGRQNDGYPGL